MLTVTDLRKTFGTDRAAGTRTRAVDNVSLDVPTGAFATVLGPSGSGKTTVLRCIAGFERPDSGEISLGGRRLVGPGVDVRPYRRRVGIVPQEGALFPHLTVVQNIGFGLTTGPRAAKRARVRELLELVGMAGYAGRRPDQLSGGQQQRVALARALAPEPELVLLDEPFSALDARLRIELREEVRSLLKTLGSTALLVTHDQAEALSLADHLVVMRAGKVIAQGDPAAVYEHPADIELAQFLGESAVLPGTLAREGRELSATCALGVLPVGHWHRELGACRVLVRPEQVRLTPGDGAGVPGTVASTTYFGHDMLVEVTVDSMPRPVPARLGPGTALRVGDRVSVTVTSPVCTYPVPSP